MQVVQELKFTFDTTLDPEIDKAVEDLVYFLLAKGQLINDHIIPNRGGATIVNRKREDLRYVDPSYPDRQAFTIDNVPDEIKQAIIDAYEAEDKWDCGKVTGDPDCDCQFPENSSWDGIKACQR